MLDVLHVFSLPESVIAAVRTLYNGADRNHGAQIVLRVTDSPTNLCLQRDAETAARSTSLDTMLRPAGRAAHAIPIWDEARVGDPGD